MPLLRNPYNKMTLYLTFGVCLWILAWIRHVICVSIWVSRRPSLAAVPESECVFSSWPSSCEKSLLFRLRRDGQLSWQRAPCGFGAVTPSGGLRVSIYSGSLIWSTDTESAFVPCSSPPRHSDPQTSPFDNMWHEATKLDLKRSVCACMHTEGWRHFTDFSLWGIKVACVSYKSDSTYNMCLSFKGFTFQMLEELRANELNCWSFCHYLNGFCLNADRHLAKYY